MNNKPISNLFFSSFLTSIIGVGIFSNFVLSPAQAETKTANTPTPEFTTAKKAGKFKLQGNGKPFKPTNLNLQRLSQPRGVIGKDDRIPLTSRQYPWSTIGRIVGVETSGKKYHCTGTLIDENVVLTNAHCVLDHKTHKFNRGIQFQPNVIDGKISDRTDVSHAVRVIAGTDFQSGNGYKNDWAIVVLDKPLGKKYGYLGWKYLPTSNFKWKPQQLIFVGYSGDFPTPKISAFRRFTAGRGWTAGVDLGCSILGEKSEVLLHDCDTTGGSSGGPIIDWNGGSPYIVALNNAEQTTWDGRGVVNFAVKMSRLSEFFYGG